MVCDFCSDRLRDEVLTKSTALGRNSNTLPLRAQEPLVVVSCQLLTWHRSCAISPPLALFPLPSTRFSHTILPLEASPNSSSLHPLWPLGNFYGFGSLARVSALPTVSFTCQSLGALHVELPSSRILGKDSCGPSCLFLGWFF